MPPFAWQNCRIVLQDEFGSTRLHFCFSANTGHKQVTLSHPTSRQLKVSYHLRSCLTRMLHLDATDRSTSCFPLVSCGGDMGRYLSPMSDETSRPARPGELRLSPASQFWPDQSPSRNTPYDLMRCGTMVLMRAGGAWGGKKSPASVGFDLQLGSVLAVLHGTNYCHSSAPVNFQIVLND